MTAYARTFAISHDDEETMAEALASRVNEAVVKDNLKGMSVFAGVGFDILRFHRALSDRLPGIPIFGATSCLGTGTEDSFHPAPSVTAMAFYGEGFHIGTSYVTRQNGSTRAQGRTLATQAAENAGISPESARFAFLFYAIGKEQPLLEGIYDVLPKDMPILGGGAADNDLSGAWYVWNESNAGPNGAVLMVCDWPWELATAFESGYLVSGPKGKATEVHAGRILKTIDGKPAAEVYNDWVDGAIGDKLKGGIILRESTLNPFGIKKQVEGMSAFVLVHPEKVLPDGSIKLFASIEDGAELHLMFSRQATLVKRPERLSKLAFAKLASDADSVVASVLIYCGGCLFSIKESADEMLANFHDIVDAPAISAFTFGEVGCVLPYVYGHGNLMAGVLFLTTHPRPSLFPPES